MAYKRFDGTKFRRPNEIEVQVHDEWDGHLKTEIQLEFKLTNSYFDYLREKENHERKTEIQTLIEKLDYEYKTYGEVDELEYQNLVYLINKYMKDLESIYKSGKGVDYEDWTRFKELVKKYQ